jgi:DNA-binding NarL/FixJ family response regulator
MKAKPPRLAAVPRKRILLVDDHPLMREGISQWIARAGDLEVCGEAATAAEALQLTGRLKPDLVLTDISLPGRNGIEFLKDLRAQHPRVPALVLSMHDENLYAGRALRAGARGYIMKRAGGERVLQGIREVLAGRIALSADMATQLLEEYSGVRRQSSKRPLPQLTDREFEVLSLIGEARSNREIAAQLHLSPKTVETHRLNLMRKLKVTNAAQLMRFALQYAEAAAAGDAPAV